MHRKKLNLLDIRNLMYPRVTLLLMLVNLKNTPLELKNTKDLDSLKKEVSLVQDNVLSGLDPSEYSITYKYEGLSVLALQITESALEKLNSNPLVEGVGTGIKLKVDDNFEPI